MSDDEGPDDYGDYEGEGPPDEEAAPDGAAGPELADEAGEEGEPPGDDEAGADAAGSDDDDADDDGAPPDEAGEEGEDPARAAPQRARVDPILRASNKARTVRVVPPDERVTDHRLQRAEAAYIIAMRAEHIAKYATSFTSAPTLHDPVAIAFKELYDRRTPFILRRAVGTGAAGELLVEEWNVREMTLPPLTAPVPLDGTSTVGGAWRGPGL